jgi:hypothetical protein
VIVESTAVFNNALRFIKFLFKTCFVIEESSAGLLTSILHDCTRFRSSVAALADCGHLRSNEILARPTALPFRRKPALVLRGAGGKEDGAWDSVAVTEDHKNTGPSATGQHCNGWPIPAIH